MTTTEEGMVYARALQATLQARADLDRRRESRNARTVREIESRAIRQATGQGG